MDLVVDANIIFAALIKDGVSSNILFNSNFTLFTPEFVIFELEKHKEKILEYTNRPAHEFSRLLEILQRRIIHIPHFDLVNFVEEAEKITPDPDDMAYFAAALKLNCAIWSNDKKLKEQNRIRIYHTHELSKLNE